MALSIEDKLELHELAGRYGDIIDDRNWSALDTVFTEDAIFEVVALVTMQGLPDIKRYMAEDGRHPLAHLITNIHVEERGDSVRLLSRGIFPISSDHGGAGHTVFYGSYYDEVCITSKGWRISHRVFSARRQANANANQ
ncbi:MAG: nuclear transport factor 2 family protein [Pseudomonadales bacterium]|nr:nuclear transport factor 2 family protein [Halioglobus sp.]MCP5192110.1 nuclear transport factor 2 family protein [Pseudomonadales bacterium]